MFAYLVGSVDWNSAFVLVAMFGALTLPTSIMLAKRRSATELKNELELSKIRLHNEETVQERNQRFNHETAMAKLGMNREIEFKRIDSGMLDLKTVRSTEENNGEG